MLPDFYTAITEASGENVAFCTGVHACSLAVVASRVMAGEHALRKTLKIVLYVLRSSKHSDYKQVCKLRLGTQNTLNVYSGRDVTKPCINHGMRVRSCRFFMGRVGLAEHNAVPAP
jgi:hypothetical protein